MNFTNPLYVSSEPDKDFAYIRILQSELFVSSKDGLTLEYSHSFGAWGYDLDKVTVPA